MRNRGKPGAELPQPKGIVNDSAVRHLAVYSEGVSSHRPAVVLIFKVMLDHKVGFVGKNNRLINAGSWMGSRRLFRGAFSKA
jgi:hypothetical protein